MAAPDSYDTVVLAQLKRGVAIENARRNFGSILERLAAEYPQDKALLKNTQLYPLRFLQTGPVAGILWPLLDGAMLLLLVACVNVSGLTLARGFARRREMAIRSVLGARRYQIAGHLLTESLFVSFLGATLALPISIGAVYAFKIFGPAGLRFVVSTCKCRWMGVIVIVCRSDHFALHYSLRVAHHRRLLPL